MDEFLEKTVSIVTADGKFMTGRMRGFDQSTNVILEDCIEWAVSEDGVMEQIPLGLYIVRGNNIAFVSEIDLEGQAEMMDRLGKEGALANMESLRPLRH